MVGERLTSAQNYRQFYDLLKMIVDRVCLGSKDGSLKLRIVLALVMVGEAIRDRISHLCPYQVIAKSSAIRRHPISEFECGILTLIPCLAV